MSWGNRSKILVNGILKTRAPLTTPTLFDDERVKHYIPAITEYPYTIEYEYEQRYKQTLHFNNWDTQPGLFNVAVENSSLQIYL